MQSRKIYKSPHIIFNTLDFKDVLLVSGGDDFGDWGSTTWGTTGGAV